MIFGNIRQRIQEIATKVFPRVYSGSESIGTSETSLSSQSVPRGSQVLVRADPGNGDKVFVGGSNEGTSSFPLEAGASTTFSVSEVSQVQARANSGTQTVNWITEGE